MPLQQYYLGLHGQYALWAGTVLDRHRPIVLITEPGHKSEATLRLGRIGFDQVAGYVAGGLDALAARPELTRQEGCGSHGGCRASKAPPRT